jgi:putative glutamine amidotransferase
MKENGRPLVAVTTSFNVRAGPHGKPMVIMHGAYVNVLDRLGFASVLLAPAHEVGSVYALLEHCHGLLLTGGGDVDPKYYGEQPRTELDGVLQARDELEFAALGFAIKRRMPILGICRGLQVLNVHLGGTLWQDIDMEVPSQIRHQQVGRWEERSHDVDIEPESKLFAVVGTRVHINSFHHQAIREPAPRLRVTGRSEDGLVEAAELVDYPFGVGVQWHPERGEATAPESDPDRRLFAAFQKAVLEHVKANGGRP